MLLKSNGAIISSDIEYSRNILKQFRGLMFRHLVSNSYAMIFILPSLRKISLHMLFVFFSIDVLFLDEEKRIVKICHMIPWLGFCHSGQKVKYVIEMPSGTVSAHALKIGDKLMFDSS